MDMLATAGAEARPRGRQSRPQSSATTAVPIALPGLWREDGGNDDLVRLDLTASTPGMVVVAKRCEDWRTRPELRWQTWPDTLQLITD